MKKQSTKCPSCGKETGKPYASLMNREQVADMLNVNVSTVRNLERSGKIPRVQITGVGVRYRPSTIQAYIEGREIYVNSAF